MALTSEKRRRREDAVQWASLAVGLLVFWLVLSGLCSVFHIHPATSTTPILQWVGDIARGILFLTISTLTGISTGWWVSFLLS